MAKNKNLVFPYSTDHDGQKQFVALIAFLVSTLIIDLFYVIFNGKLLIHKNDMAQNSNTLEQVWWTP